MFQSIARLWKKKPAQSRTSGRPRSSRRLKLESLEGRQLFAVLAGEVQINTATASDQSEVAISSAADGRSVAVWTHTATSSNTDIRAQRFDAAGNRVGTEIIVANSTRRESLPDVAMRSDGSFTVTWVDQVTSSNRDVKALRFTSTGVPTGSVINVASSRSNESTPSIAMSTTGTFVIGWMRESGFNRGDIFANRYSNTGLLLNALTVAAASTENELSPDVAMSPDGRFAVGYSTNLNGGDVIVKRYSSSAALVGTHAAATGSTRQLNPRVSMDDNANVMVVWNEFVVASDDIKARLISNRGAMAGVITVANTSNVQEINPDVAFKRDGTAFVVTYVNRADNTARSAEFTVTGTVRNQSTVARQAAVDNRVAVAFGLNSNYRMAYSRRATGLDAFQLRGVLS